MRFAADENFDNRIVRGLLRRRPAVDIIRIQDSEVAGADDPTVLAWTGAENRILLTHDQQTVPRYAFERMARGETIAGVIVVGKSLAIGTAIEELLIVIECSSSAEWINQVQRLPL